VLRRRPEARFRLKPEKIKELTKLQGKILMDSCQLVKPGGVLIYSTCSILPEENTIASEIFELVGGFTLLAEKVTLPTKAGSDGGYYSVWKRI